jgi:hypothetical protein
MPRSKRVSEKRQEVSKQTMEQVAIFPFETALPANSRCTPPITQSLCGTCIISSNSGNGGIFLRVD